MKILDFLKGTSEKVVSTEMIEILSVQLPPSKLATPNRMPSVNEVTRALERTITIARIYQTDKKLGTIGRARLANHFKWGLKEKGYQDDFIELATESLVMELAKVAHGARLK